jgi:hypothetical protein
MKFKANQICFSKLFSYAMRLAPGNKRQRTKKNSSKRLSLRAIKWRAHLRGIARFL